MLAAAREKSAQEKLNIEWIKGDIRDFALGKKFSLAILPFNTLCHLLTLTDFEACLGSCPQGSIEYYGGIRDVTITVTFDGSDQAQWSSSKGPEGTLPLFCP